MKFEGLWFTPRLSGFRIVLSIPDISAYLRSTGVAWVVDDTCQRGNATTTNREQKVVKVDLQRNEDFHAGEEKMIPRLKDNMLTIYLALLYMSVWSSFAVEFTFELPDRDRQCFYEDIKQGTKGTLEYQVIK